ncbi:hypothetical protein TruAng_003259 [Truncatella angustata]|nr:hypothetical protein TruAng_003259 [Truncatella angustata]
MANRLYRLRHIHIPDSAPHYPPFDLVKRVDRLLRSQIRHGRPKLRRSRGGKACLACPPPTVLSFTSAPAYFIENTSIRTRKSTAAALESIRLTWPRSEDYPAPVSNFHVSSGDEGDQPQATAAVPGDPFDHTYKPDLLEPLLDLMPPYHGPGRLVLWPVIDMHTLGATGSAPVGQELAALLAHTTSAMLRREFGIATSVGRDFTSLIVSSGAQIAAIWPGTKDGASTYGVTINIAEPQETVSAKHIQQEDAVAQDSGDEVATTVAGELASVHELAPLESIHNRRFVALKPVGDLGDAVTKGSQWYTRTYETNVSFAPLGMDNYGFAVSWAYELARAMDISFVESKTTNGWELRDFSKSVKQPRLTARPQVYTQSAEPENHDVPSIEQGRVPSWDLTQRRLLRDLEKSVGGKKLDTRKVEEPLKQKPGPNSRELQRTGSDESKAPRRRRNHRT